MKLPKIKSSDVSIGVAQVAGGAVGFVIPNGLANTYAKVDDETIITEEQKKKKMLANGVLLIGGVLASLLIKGDNILAVGGKSLAMGIASGGAVGLIKPALAKKVAENTTDGTAGSRFIKGALGCPDMNTSFYSKTLNRPRLNMAIMESQTPVYSNSNSKDAFASFTLS
ncbi:hypothetical protein [Flavobacterium sp. J27]|uniref:hypothetical protein n=1 Tax=Flavobacterium sp. J27 TaxID=2060419 RepID=UPI00102FA0F5|nr:hypothetical protein [Flavobacterium sp. J27]